MAHSMRFFATILLLAMLVMATEMGPMRIAEARHCESKSQRFKGPCVRQKNCAAVCETEGFPGGDCRGFRRRCFCTRPC
ncbi:Defensin-like protein [Capsicum baccatum]|uniref:Defensin-like protein n=2 Tax=Capsicum TaxID=4071 RepID=A0A2G2Z0J1_CAPAN|nr:defensin-like protein P322 [Capsicum annuum]KAF3674012.1 Defensin-like protein [Capsicum annuum]KAF3676733.1 Defensin-like protein [Capsicum annuum]PHT42493.1 Defensin-like protein [Capsicum baccatum]PHT75530.1 Defensin-like protein [Capsicum annuum]